MRGLLRSEVHPGKGRMVLVDARIEYGDRHTISILGDEVLAPTASIPHAFATAVPFRNPRKGNESQKGIDG